MQQGTLRTLMRVCDVSQAQLASEVGVSRQAVSLWLRGGADPSARHLQKVSQVLGVSMEQLLEPLPCLEGERAEELRTTLLWDRLYPSVGEFAVALLNWEPKAVARLVQTYGLFASFRMLGKRVWRQYPSYAKFIHPAKRRSLDKLWQIEKHQTVV